MQPVNRSPDYIAGLRRARDVVWLTAVEIDNTGGHKYALAVREAVAAIDAVIAAEKQIGVIDDLIASASDRAKAPL